MESTRLTLSRTRLTYEGGILCRTDPTGATLMSLSGDRFGRLRLEKRLQGGGFTFLLPGMIIGALTARFGEHGWVKLVFYSLATILGFGALVAFRGSYIVVPGVRGEEDLAIFVADTWDEAAAFIFSVNQGRAPTQVALS
jgi:hypothetical protein